MSFAAVLVSAVLAFAPFAPRTAEDFTGKWSGAFNAISPDGSVSQQAIELNLTQKGKALTGTAGPSATRQWNIIKGAVDGNKLIFDVQTTEGSGVIINFVLTYADGHLKGDATADDQGQKRAATIDATRVK